MLLDLMIQLLVCSEGFAASVAVAVAVSSIGDDDKEDDDADLGFEED